MRRTLLLLLAVLVSRPLQGTERHAGEVQFGSLSVAITTDTGARLTSVYAGLISPRAPWRTPTVELVAREASFTVRAPAGEYRLFVGHDGFQPVIQTVTLAPGKVVKATVALNADKPVVGTLHDSNGSPLPGGSCSHIERLLPAALAKRSELARSVLNGLAPLPVDPDGHFDLALPTDRLTPLLCSAPRLAAVVVFAKASEPVSVILPPGGSLTLDLDRDDDDYVIELANPDGRLVPPNWQPRVWTRTARKSLSFDSLEPGEYSVYGYAPNPLRFSTRTLLGRATVTQDASARLSVTLPGLPPRSTVHSSVLLRSKSVPDLLYFKAFMDDGEGNRRAIAYSAEPVAGGTMIHLPVNDPRSAWLESTQNMIFAATPARSGADYEGVLLSRGEASIGFALDEGSPLPTAGRVRFEGCSGRGAEVFELPLRLDAETHARFAGPAGCKALRFAFSGYAPVALARPLQPDTDAWLGTHRLLATAGVEVRVAGDPGATPAAMAEVRVFRHLPDKPGHQLTLASGVTDEQGALALDDLPAGIPLMVAARSADGSRAGTVPVELLPAERRVVALMFSAPVGLRVALRFAPGLQQQLERARITRLQLSSEVARAWRTDLSADTDDEGVAEFEHIQPGRWRAVALVQVDGSNHPIELEPIEVDESTPSLLMREVSLHLLAGRVTEEGRGVPASVGFRKSPGGIRQHVATDDDGAFEIVLPASGQYQIELNRKSDPGYRMPLGELTVSRTLQNVSLVIPSGRLAVTVREGDRTPAGVAVTARPRRPDLAGGSGGVLRRATDAEGNAMFDGLVDGEWLIEARDERTGKAASRLLPVHGGATAVAEIQF